MAELRPSHDNGKSIGTLLKLEVRIGIRNEAKVMPNVMSMLRFSGFNFTNYNPHSISIHFNRTFQMALCGVFFISGFSDYCSPI